MIAAVIFDLDGVLVSTDRFHFLAWQQIASEEGIDFSEKDNEKLRGVSRLDSLKIILSASSKRYSYEDLDRLCAKKNEIYRQYLHTLSSLSVKAEVRSTLEKLKASGYRLALGSVSKNAITILEQTDLKRYFDVIGDGTKVKNSKPDPEIFLYAASELGLPPTACLVVEDALAGLQAAKAGGFVAVGYNTPEPYAAADYLIDDLGDIFSVIAKEGR